MGIFTRVGDEWTINFDVIHNFIKNNSGSDDEMIDKIKSYILYNMSYNRKMITTLLRRRKSELNYCYCFDIQLKPDSTVILIEISINDIIDYYKKNFSSLKKWQLKLYKKIINDNCDEKTYSNYCHKKVSKNITYGDIFDLLKLSEDSIEELINNNNFKGISGEEFYKLVYKYLFDGFAWNKELFEIFNISKEEEKIIQKNFKKIKYNFEPNYTLNDDFVEAKNISSKFDLNNNLCDSVLNGMPKNYSKLQQAYYIYRRLCQMFSYDEDFFCYCYLAKKNKDIQKTRIDHADINRLNNIEINSDVICTEITMLFVKFLDILNIPYRIVDYYDNDNVKYVNSHMKVKFKIDDCILEADAAHGLFGCDMSREKTFGQVKNFVPVQGTPLRILKKVYDQMDVVDEYFFEIKDNSQFEDAVLAYEMNYKRNNNISIEERISMLVDIIKRSDLKMFDMMYYINHYKNNIFSPYDDACYIEYVINTKPIQDDKSYEIVIMFIYNDNKDVNKSPKTNKYFVITSDKKLEKLSYDQVRDRFKTGEYAFAGDARADIYKKWDDSDECQKDDRERTK